MASYATAATINVPADGNFQTALNQALPGDVIVLAAGATYATQEGFILPNKGSSTQYITIQSSNLNSLPSDGFRVRPNDVPNMPKIMSTNNGEAVLTAAEGAHHYRLLGLEFTVAPNRWSYRMLEFGVGNETNLNQLPHDIIVDRCYIHGDPTARPGTKRGVQLNGANIAILNSYISEIHVEGSDAQAINGWNGPGPFQIINNYLEASTENILFGGADPKITGLIPSDIEVRNNHMYKPFRWMASHPTYEGIAWDIKNTFELKNAQRVVIDGNIFENCWEAGQTGVMILFTVRNQDGGAPWSAIRDVSFTRNIVQNTGSAFSITGNDDDNVSEQSERITVRDNLILNVDNSTYGGAGRVFQFTTGSRPALDVTVDHNTMIHSPNSGGASAYVGDCCSVLDQFTFTNNIATYADFGFKGGNVGEGLSALNQYVPNYQFFRNAFIGGGTASSYPNLNYFASSMADTGFVDAGQNDFRLAETSPYHNAGSDNRDLGADVSAVLAVTCGVRSGVPANICASQPPLPPLPPTWGNLATPILDLPATLAVNAEVRLRNASSYANTSFNWSVTALPSDTADPQTAAPAAAQPVTAVSQAPHLPLGSLHLHPGVYEIAVQARAGGQQSSRVTANVSLIQADLSLVRAYPNPWRSDRHPGRAITFDNLSPSSEVKIYTVAGFNVKALRPSSTTPDRVDWDRTNDSGDLVASGIYLYSIKDGGGAQARGRIAIIK